MADRIEQALKELEAGLTPPDYERLITAFRSLQIPGDVDSGTLKRVYRLCFRILGLAPGEPPLDSEHHIEPWQTGHLEACAASAIEESLFDRNAQTRRWIREREERYRVEGKPTPAGFGDQNLPPELHIPWDLETAREEIAPFLAAYERNLAQDPGVHFKLCYDVMSDGYPVFRTVFGDWMDALEQRGLGHPGMRMAIEKSVELDALANEPEPISWQECEAELLPLLDHAHPMIAAGAARYLGALFAEAPFPDDEKAPGLPEFLEDLAQRSEHRRSLCGAFIRGLDTECRGLGTLATDPRLQAFDLDEWVVEVLSLDEEEPFLPNVQAFWFYVHEYYDTDPGFITRLIEMDRAWIAMMCATESPSRIEGMEPVLHRLAENPDPEIAAHAESHLARHYSH
ncbi:hypothetical protein [Methyloligella halotolerans]|nr:hypothetical protein [Methyloligella halotolerans]